MKSDVTPDTCDTDPEIPDSNVTIVAGSKHMTIYSVPLNLWGTNYNNKKHLLWTSSHLMLQVIKVESLRWHCKFLWDVTGDSSFATAASKLNESSEYLETTKKMCLLKSMY